MKIHDGAKVTKGETRSFVVSGGKVFKNMGTMWLAWCPYDGKSINSSLRAEKLRKEGIDTRIPGMPESFHRDTISMDKAKGLNWNPM